MDWETVRFAADGRWPEILTALGLDLALLRARHGPCPGCGGTDRFRFPDKGRGEWYCSGGGSDVLGGDGFALLGHALGWDKAQQLRQVAAVLGIEDRELSPQEREAYARRRREAQAQQEREAHGRHVLRVLERATARYRVRYASAAGAVPVTPEEVRQRARAHWGQGTPLEEGSQGHPYLLRKGVGAYGGLRLHKSNGTLMVPLRQVGGQLCGLQFLPAEPSGAKTFLKDMAPMQGLVHILGDVDPLGWMGIAEGYATAASMHALADLVPGLEGRLPVAVGWSTACLEATGRALLARWPRLRLLWLADWDGDKAENPGTTAASWAAEVCGGLVLPAPGCAGEKLDWNDAAQQLGERVLREQWARTWDTARAAAAEGWRRDRDILAEIVAHGL